MKKIFLFAVCAISLMVASCGSNDYLQPKEMITKGNESKLDTLSYIVGIDMGNQIANGIVPQLQADFDAIVSTLEKMALTPDSKVKVCDIEICADSLNALGMKYLGLEFNNRVMAALSDTTGNTKIYADNNEKLIVSSLIGANFGHSLTTANLPLQTTWIVAAINDVKNNAQKIDDDTAEKFIMNYYTNVMPEEAKAKEKEWLGMIEKKRGVQKTESGILYIIEEEGDSKAKAINDNDTVKVLYTGRDCYGEVFDTNRWNDMPKERQEMLKQYDPENSGKDNPIEFPLDRVIKGWTEGMKLVGKGGKITLWIPSEYAYGERGTQGIAPYSALRFDVELIDVKPAK